MFMLLNLFKSSLRGYTRFRNLRGKKHRTGKQTGRGIQGIENRWHPWHQEAIVRPETVASYAKETDTTVCTYVCAWVCVWTVCTNFSSSCSTRRNLQRDDRWCNGSSQHPRRFFDPPLAEPGPFSRLFAAEREWNGPRAKSARDYRDESARTRLVRGGGGLNWKKREMACEIPAEIIRENWSV